jgi:voltage-gated potassium channel
MWKALHTRVAFLRDQGAARYDALRRVLERRIALNRWFPQIPLALALLAMGYVLFHRAANFVLGVSPLNFRFEDLERHFMEAKLEGVPDFVIGGLLIVLALGLARHARFAWSIAVIGIGISLVLNSHPATESDPAAVLAFRILLLVALLSSRRHFTANSVITQAAFSLYALTAFFAVASAMALRRGAHFDPPIEDPITALYFVVITVSSVGFGDITPQDTSAREFVLGLILVGFSVLGAAISVSLMPILGNRFRLMLGNQEKHVTRAKHYVVIGTSALARNVTNQLEQREQLVTIILGKPSDHSFYEGRDVIIGDATELDVLRSAGVPQSRGVLALSTDDSTNGFVVLGVNELDATIPTVAALNDPANQSRVERTQPSMIFSLDVLGGQLLAMALTGEHVDMSVLDDVLKIHTNQTATSAP